MPSTAQQDARIPAAKAGSHIEADNLAYGPGLLALAGLSGADVPGTAVRRAGQQRLASLLDSGQLRFADLPRSPEHLTALACVAGYAQDTALLASLLDELDDQRLGELAIAGTSPLVRQSAAERVQDPERIAQLLKTARGGDKNVYRVLKAKRDAELATERAAAEALAHCATLCASLERHIHQPFGDAYVSALEHLEGQWHAAAAQASAELQARAAVALERCHEIVQRHLRETARRAAAELAQAATLERVATERPLILQAAHGLLAEVCQGNSSDTAPDVDAQRIALAAQWQSLSELHPATREEQTQFARLDESIAAIAAFNSQFTSLESAATGLTEERAPALRRAVQQLQFLGELAPPQVSATQAALQAFDQARAADQESRASALRRVGGLLRKAQAALAAGHSRQAAGMRRSMEDKLQRLSLPPALAAQVQAFDAELGMLQDWRSFAVAPKRTELIEQMEALIGDAEEPPVLAEQIKRLQDEWKLISQGNTEDTQAEWQRFHEAAQKAYEPCREYFARQAEVRAEKLEARRALLARLQAFAASQIGEHTDWNLVARALRESAQQWRSLQPVDRGANRPLQDEFDAIRAALQTQLDAAHAENVEARRALIAQAQQLVGLPDGRQAAEEVKRLQAVWQSLGPVAQNDSQALWQEFRVQCDAVFARRHQQQEEFVTQLTANGARATELCVEAEALLPLAGTELIEGARKIPALREAFLAVGELPRAEANALRNRFERACDRCEKNLAQLHARAQSQAGERIFSAADLIRRYRLAVAEGADAATCAARREEARTFLDDPTAHWPKGALPALKAELARECSPDLDANEEALRLLCIRAELLTGVETPPADQDRRRAWQMQQLMKGLGQARATGPDAFQALVREWVATGASRDPLHAELLARFLRCQQRAHD